MNSDDRLIESPIHMVFRVSKLQCSGDLWTGLLINMQKLVFGTYLPDFTS